jgi:hypothetical protein
MATIRFQAGEVGLELAGSEQFVERQLLLLAPFLGDVDKAVIHGGDRPEVRAEPPPEPERTPEPEPDPVTFAVESFVSAPSNGPTVTEVPVAAAIALDDQDGLRSFYLAHEPHGRDSQTDAALLLAYYMNRMEGRESMRVGDLVQSCIRAGVDTRNLNRPLGVLTRRGLLEQGAGNTYRISSQGVQTVESRL